MTTDTLLLVEKICKFLQDNDYVRLTKILTISKEESEIFFPLIEKFKKRSLSQKLGEITSSLATGGFPFGIIGIKAEKDELKKKLREDRIILGLELKNIIKTSPLSSDEKKFLDIIYRVIY